MRLSKAQENTLNWIRERYEETLVHELETYRREVEQPETRPVKGLSDEYYKEQLAYAERGFILLHSFNSKTLEKLAEAGYIEYLKNDKCRSYPLDRVKLLSK